MFPLVFRYLSAEGVAHMHPVVLWRIVAVDGLGETTAYVDKVIERNGRDIGFGEGNRFLQLPAVWLWVITLDLKHNENGCLIILKSLNFINYFTLVSYFCIIYILLLQYSDESVFIYMYSNFGHFVCTFVILSYSVNCFSFVLCTVLVNNNSIGSYFSAYETYFCHFDTLFRWGKNLWRTLQEILSKNQINVYKLLYIFFSTTIITSYVQKWNTNIPEYMNMQVL